ncbi:MAG: hypothetical protein NVSMB52_04620 [Chloroflexota bacterium]
MPLARYAPIGGLLLLLASTGVVGAQGYGYGTTESTTTHRSAAGPAHTTKRVNIGEANNKYRYVAPKVIVKVGTRVIWKNGSDAPHTITSTKTGLFDKSVSAGKTVSIVFKKRGTYSYFCSIHPYMHGKVVVK